MVAGALVVEAGHAAEFQRIIRKGSAVSRSRAVRSIVPALLDGSKSDGVLQNVSGQSGIGALCGGGGGGGGGGGASVVMIDETGLSSDGIIER